MTDKEFDLLIRRTVQQYGEEYEQSDAGEHTFSEGFERRMTELIQGRKKKNRWRIVRSISAVAAVLVIGVIGVNVLLPMMRSGDSNSTLTKDQTAAAEQIEKSHEPALKPDNALTQTDEIDKNYSNDIIANEGTKSTQASSFQVTAKSGKTVVILSEEKVNALAETVLELVADNSIPLDRALTEEEIAYYEENGSSVIVSGKYGEPLEIFAGDYGIFHAETIQLLFDNESGYAIVADGEEMRVFSISGLKGIFSELQSSLE